jgi:hypothetical protein
MNSRTLSADPATVPSAHWQARLGAFKSRGVPDDDDRVVECVQSLAFWRVKRSIDAQAQQLSPSGVDALVDQLRRAVSA